MLDTVNTPRFNNPLLSRKKFGRLIAEIHEEQQCFHEANKYLSATPLLRMDEEKFNAWCAYGDALLELREERETLIARWHKDQAERKREADLRRATRRKFRNLSELEREAFIYFTLSGQAGPAEMFMGHADSKRFVHPECERLMAFNYDGIANIVQLLRTGQHWVTTDAIELKFVLTRSFATATRLAYLSALAAVE